MWKDKRKPSKARKLYSIDLEKAREIHGNWIPFGYNLNLLKTKVKQKESTTPP